MRPRCFVCVSPMSIYSDAQRLSDVSMLKPSRLAENFFIERMAALIVTGVMTSQWMQYMHFWFTSQSYLREFKTSVASMDRSENFSETFVYSSSDRQTNLYMFRKMIENYFSKIQKIRFFCRR